MAYCSNYNTCTVLAVHTVSVVHFLKVMAKVHSWWESYITLADLWLFIYLIIDYIVFVDIYHLQEKKWTARFEIQILVFCRCAAGVILHIQKKFIVQFCSWLEIPSYSHCIWVPVYNELCTAVCVFVCLCACNCVCYMVKVWILA